MTREHLPDTRPSVTREITFGQMECSLTIGFYADGRPAELFAEIGAEGSTVRGLVNAWLRTLSIALQFGAEWRNFVEKSSGQSYPPQDDKYPSVEDAIMREADDMVKGVQAGNIKPGPVQPATTIVAPCTEIPK